MATVPPPPKSAPPPPSNASGTIAKPVRKFSVSSGTISGPQRVGIYGEGGTGKSTLASLLAAVGIKPLFIDLEMGTQALNVDRVGDANTRIETWEELRGVLRDESLWSGVGAVVLDNVTCAEELAVQWTIQNVKHEKGHEVKSVEGYGYGKGYQHVFETMLCLFADLDNHIRNGRHVVCIAHDCIEKVNNPAGDDYARYEPRLQDPPKMGKTRLRFREWLDHLCFIGFDVAVDSDGKSKGAGTRQIYCQQLPHIMAKSRTLSATPISFANATDATLWKTLFNK